MLVLFLGITGIIFGLTISIGLSGLIIALSIFPRYAILTDTRDKILLYEDAAILGINSGNLFYLFGSALPFGKIILFLYGLFSGFFLGAWILSLAEIAQVFPVLRRRFNIHNRIPVYILFMALGKIAGALYYFSHGWQ